jgi:hypothetical protein
MMIQANELRVGNWIDFQSTPGQFEKVQDTKTEGVKSPSINRVDIEDLEPIYLTLELLEKCDFKKGEPISKGYYIPYSSNQYSNFIINYCPSNNSFWLDGYVYDVKIEFLHHLQNIYHALIGQELQVNL